MLRISKLTDYAVVMMAYLAKHSPVAYTAKEIAQGTKIALPTVSKLLKVLARNGMLSAQRGVNGGYSLAMAASNISLAQIINALEGKIALTECGHQQGLCVMEARCTVRHNWQMISAAIGAALEGIKLAQMIAPISLTQKNSLQESLQKQLVTV